MHLTAVVQTGKTVSAASEITYFPLACLNVHHSGLVLFCEVFEQDHVVLFIGVVNKHCLGAHTQHLKRGRGEGTRLSSESLE